MIRAGFPKALRYGIPAGAAGETPSPSLFEKDRANPRWGDRAALSFGAGPLSVSQSLFKIWRNARLAQMFLLGKAI